MKLARRIHQDPVLLHKMPASLIAQVSQPDSLLDQNDYTAHRDAIALIKVVDMVSNEVRNVLSQSPSERDTHGINLLHGLTNNLGFRDKYCADLMQYQFQQLLATMTYCRYPKRKVIFQENQTGEDAYIVLCGTVEISRRQNSGKQNKITELKAGNSLGDLVLKGFSGRSTTAKATSNFVELICITRSSLQQLNSNTASVDQKFNFLQALPLFKNAHTYRTYRLACMMKELRCDRGDVVVSSNTLSPALIILFSGEILVKRPVTTHVKKDQARKHSINRGSQPKLGQDASQPSSDILPEVEVLEQAAMQQTLVKESRVKTEFIEKLLEGKLSIYNTAEIRQDAVDIRAQHHVGRKVMISSHDITHNDTQYIQCATGSGILPLKKIQGPFKGSKQQKSLVQSLKSDRVRSHQNLERLVSGAVFGESGILKYAQEAKIIPHHAKSNKLSKFSRDYVVQSKQATLLILPPEHYDKVEPEMLALLQSDRKIRDVWQHKRANKVSRLQQSVNGIQSHAWASIDTRPRLSATEKLPESPKLSTSDSTIAKSMRNWSSGGSTYKKGAPSKISSKGRPSAKDFMVNQNELHARCLRLSNAIAKSDSTRRSSFNESAAAAVMPVQARMNPAQAFVPRDPGKIADRFHKETCDFFSPDRYAPHIGCLKQSASVDTIRVQLGGAGKPGAVAYSHLQQKLDSQMNIMHEARTEKNALLASVGMATKEAHKVLHNRSPSPFRSRSPSPFSPSPIRQFSHKAKQQLPPPQRKGPRTPSPAPSGGSSLAAFNQIAADESFGHWGQE